MDSFSLTIKGKAAAAAACFDWSLKEGLEWAAASENRVGPQANKKWMFPIIFLGKLKSYVMSLGSNKMAPPPVFFLFFLSFLQLWCGAQNDDSNNVRSWGWKTMQWLERTLLKKPPSSPRRPDLEELKNRGESCWRELFYRTTEQLAHFISLSAEWKTEIHAGGKRCLIPLAL